MSQHDYDVANQAGAAFRADLNLALQALVGNNSGTSAPSVTFPYMFWVDTSAGVLKMRNAGNTAWVTIGLLGVQNFGHILPGAIVFHAKSAAPTGFLKANGAAVSRITYADLFAEIGTAFGVGDGSTTFNLPEMRGEFLRGWDDSRGIDAARAFGSSQAQMIAQHGHSVRSYASGGTALDTPRPLVTGVWNGSFYDSADANGVNGSVAIGAENRPRNIALLACIKY